MPLKPTRAVLEHTLHQRDAEIVGLRARLAAVIAPIPPGVGIPVEFLWQVQALCAGILLIDMQGLIIWANAGFLEYCHCTLTDLMGRPLSDLTPSLQLDVAMQATVADWLAGQEAFEFELPDHAPEHTRNWLHLKVQPLHNAAQGEVEMFLGLLQDITPKRKAQRALAESEKRFRDLAEYAPVALYYGHQNNRGQRKITYCSPKLQELFSVDGVEHLRGCFHPEDQAACESFLGSTLVANIPMTIEFRLLVPGRPLRWCRAISTLSGQVKNEVNYWGSVEDITLSKQAEEEARTRTLRRLLVMEGLGMGSWEYHYDTGSTSVSPEGMSMLGYDEQTSIDEHIVLADYIHPDDLAPTSQEWVACRDDGKELFSCEYRLRCYDGGYKWVLGRGVVTNRDAQGRPLIFTGVIGDISARKEVQATLAITALRLTTTIKKLKGGVLLVDANGKVVLTNNSFCRLFGLKTSAKKLIGTDYYLLEEKIKRCIARPIGEALDMSLLITRRIETRLDLFTLRSGHIVERDFIPVRDDGMDLGFLWKFEDVTKSYNAECSLRLREEKYRNTIDNMQLGLMEVDLEKRVLYANANFCRTVGYDNKELLGNPLPAQLLALGNRSQLNEQLSLRPHGISSAYELPFVTKDGRTKWLFISGSPLYDHNRVVTGSIGIILDITHQKEMENRLREAKQQAEHSIKAKELFLANMSHEIRTPMNAILGMSQLLARTPLATRQSNYLHAITTSAQNLLVIINDILDLSKLNAGQMSIERVGFNVPRLCAQVEKTLLYKAEEKGLDLVIQVSPYVPDVLLGDPHRITQILLNLAGNAVKFTHKGAVIIECNVVYLHEGTVELAFVVRDTGIGIDPTYLKQIFQEFSQEDTSVTREFGGTGLGLSICRRLARLMDSEIVVESEKNEGTTIQFTLSLPIGTVTDLPPRRVAASTNAQRLQGKQVLLAEDNEYNRLLAKTFLLNAHLDVTEAENGEIAIDHARRQSFDLILMDVQMPVLDGFEATRYLRQQLGLTTPIIALTASAISGEKEKCLAAGMNGYLTKPFYEDELLQLVCDWVLLPPGQPLVPSDAPHIAPVPQRQLYDLELLQSMSQGDQKFVTSMLQTFISSTHIILRDLHAALAVGNLVGLQAAAHKTSPSLRHLQIQSAISQMDVLEGWSGPFSYDDLQPVVESIDLVLREVIFKMTAELEARRANEEHQKVWGN